MSYLNPKRRTLSLDLLFNIPVSYVKPQTAPPVERQKMLHSMKKAIELELTDRQRQCVKLCYYHGYSNRAAAELMGVNESTISRHLKKAKHRLLHVLCYSYPQFDQKD